MSDLQLFDGDELHGLHQIITPASASGGIAIPDDDEVEVEAVSVGRRTPDQWSTLERYLHGLRMIRPKPYVKVRCGASVPGGWVPGCGHTLKCLPGEVPPACPGCKRPGGLFITKWVSR